MHHRETTKDPLQFRQEIDAILAGTSADHRPKDKFDFTQFVFPETNFSRAKFTQHAYFSSASFTQHAYFSGAKFTQHAYFSGAKFTQRADFFNAEFTQDTSFSVAEFTQDTSFSVAEFTHDADFSGAKFTQGANFSGAKFTQGANFFDAKFTQGANFSGATFTEDADFRRTEFRQPERVRFYQVNQKEGTPGLRARFVNCRVEGVQFADVNWHRQGGRMVLQDELTPPTYPTTWRQTHELVAIAYRQLVNNFEKERAYGLAEECKIGAMEMKRLDPKNFLFAKGLESYYKKWRWLRWLGENLSAAKPLAKGLESYYQKWRWLRWLGENVSAANLYRLTSHYGTSYVRALLVLLFYLLVIFAVLFALPLSAIQREKPSLPPKVAVVAVPSTHWSAIQRYEPSPPPQPVLGAWNRLGAGLFHSLEVGTFQRDSLYGVPTRFGRLMSILETILVPAQLALFLLALRRRFRH